MAIRAATFADVPALERIAEDAYRPYVARLGREPAPMLESYPDWVERGDVFVCEARGEVVGYIILVAHADHLFIDNVAVAPAHHKRGFGHALLDFAESEARRRRYTEIRLLTNARMTENQRFYGGMGYVETHRSGENGFERVFFQKAIAMVGDR